jgi:hypothetical protein
MNTSWGREPETELAQIIHDSIDSLRAERRLYPDLYCNELADIIREYLKGEQNEN